MKNNKSQLEQMIQRQYSKKREELYLWEKADYWLEIIEDRDWQMLEKLYMIRCEISDDKFTAVTTKQWPNLKILWLTWNNITGIGMKQIICKQFPCLQQINLGMDLVYSENNNIGSKGSKYLIKVNWLMLDSLYLGYCQLGTEGVKHLSKGKWQNLKTFGIYNNNIKLDAYTAMSERSPKNIEHLITGEKNKERGEFEQSINVLALFSSLFIHKVYFSYITNQQLANDIEYIWDKRINKK